MNSKEWSGVIYSKLKKSRFDSVGPGPQPPPAPIPPPPGWQIVDSGTASDLDLQQAQKQLNSPAEQLNARRRIQATVRWSIEEKKDA